MAHNPLYPTQPALEAQSALTEVAEAPYYGAQAGGGSYQYLELLSLLWRGKWIILLVVAVVVGIVAIDNYTASPIYESQSLLLVHTKGSGGLNALDTGIQQAIGLGDRSLSNEIMILEQSLDIHNRVADNFLAQRLVPGTERPLPILYDEEGTLLPSERISARLERVMKVRTVGSGMDGIWIVGSSTDPGEAALIANVYAEEYIARTQEVSRARIFASRTFLEEQENRLKLDLRSLEGQVTNYMTTQGAVDLDEEATRTVEQIAQLQSMNDEASIELEMREASLRRLQEELATIEPKLVQRIASGVDLELKSVQEELAELELRVEQIYLRNPELKVNPSGNEELVEINRRREELRTRRTELSQQYVAEVLSVGGIDPSQGGGGLAYVGQRRQQAAEAQITITGLKAKIDVLENRLQGYEGKLRSIPGQALQLAQLQRAQQSTERLYVFVVDKLQEVRIAEESEIGYAEIIRPASVPGSPVRPNPKRNLLLAIIGGLFLGCGFVFVRERLNTRINRPDDLREQGHNVIGVIPSMDKVVKHEYKGHQEVLVEGKRVSTVLTMLLHPQSRVSEAYRQLRTNIQFSRPDTVVETLLMTSPDAGEGKTTTVVNLALAMAQASRRTLIIDADLRHPKIHKMLGQPGKPGLTDILFNKHPFSPEAFFTGFDNLYLIPAGSEVPNPVEVLGSQRMRALIEQLRQEFDLIIFDTPPVVPFSEAVLLSTQCDATILVAASGKTDRRAFEHAVESIRGVGGVVIGGILNRFDAKQLGYGYAYGYRYGDGYYYRYGKGAYGKRKRTKRKQDVSETRS